MNSSYGQLSGLSAQDQASANLYRQQGQPIKDPTVSDAQDAIAALRKRLDVVKTALSTMPRLQAEQARIERMLAAAAGEP